MASEAARNSPTDPGAVVDEWSMAKEISRLCGVNGITPGNKVAAITALTDAQVAQFVRQMLITGIILVP